MRADGGRLMADLREDELRHRALGARFAAGHRPVGRAQVEQPDRLVVGEVPRVLLADGGDDVVA